MTPLPHAGDLFARFALADSGRARSWRDGIEDPEIRRASLDLPDNRRLRELAKERRPIEIEPLAGRKG